MIERQSHLGSLTFVFAVPESTSRAGKAPATAEKSDRRPRWPARFGYFSGGIDRSEGELTTRNSTTKCRLGRAASVMCPAAVPILERRKQVASK